MRIMIKIIYTSFLIFMLSVALVSAQDKKTEQRIKVIVEDGSGKKVIIDTVYKDTPAPDSIKLKDGTVIFMKHEGDGADTRHGEKVNVIMRSSKENGDNDSSADETRIVIAKDGMVVTIEGNDEAKAQELAKEIENKLGVNSEGSEKKETVKVESKKTIKK